MVDRYYFDNNFSNSSMSAIKKGSGEFVKYSDYEATNKAQADEIKHLKARFKMANDMLGFVNSVECMHKRVADGIDKMLTEVKPNKNSKSYSKARIIRYIGKLRST